MNMVLVVHNQQFFRGDLLWVHTVKLGTDSDEQVKNRLIVRTYLTTAMLDSGGIEPPTEKCDYLYHAWVLSI